MENRAYALAAGIFTLLLGIAVIAAGLWFSGEAIESNEYRLVSRYPVSGLNPQAAVRYRGIMVGKVVDIRFDPLEPRTILIDISVRSGTPMTQGTYAQLGSQGITGISYVVLDDDGKNPDPLAKTEDGIRRIEVRPSFIDSVSASGQEMLDNFNQVAKRVNTLLGDENQRQLIGTLRNLDRVSEKLVSVASAFEPTLQALPALARDAGTTLRRADTLLANVNQRVESFERAANKTEQLADSGTALADSGAALADAVVTESLPRLNVLLGELQRSARGLERLMTEINEQPRSLIFGRVPLPPGPGEAGFAERRQH